MNDLPTSPRLIRTHLPVQFMPKSVWEQNCRVSDLCVILRSQEDEMIEGIILNIILGNICFVLYGCPISVDGKCS